LLSLPSFSSTARSLFYFFFSSRRRHTRFSRDWSSDVCSSDLSHYLKSRGEAEAAVKASGLDWTIFEPSVIFGPGDGFFCRFAALIRHAPVLPLARAGARFAPVYVGDVVEAFVRALGNRRTFGEVYELYGPEVFTLKE